MKMKNKMNRTTPRDLIPSRRNAPPLFPAAPTRRNTPWAERPQRKAPGLRRATTQEAPERRRAPKLRRAAWEEAVLLLRRPGAREPPAQPDGTPDVTRPATKAHIVQGTTVVPGSVVPQQQPGWFSRTYQGWQQKRS